MTQPYTTSFYEENREGSRRSAEAVVPLVMQFVRPQSVIDIGCGVGTWLSVFKEHGVGDFYGVDGSWVDRSALEIPTERFLEEDLTGPFRLDRSFDLVVSLEVAEHIAPRYADAFVDSLSGLGDLILFSAAVPYALDRALNLITAVFTLRLLCGMRDMKP